MSIIPVLSATFVPVSDMTRSVTWYSRLLGLEEVVATHEGRIYNVPVEGTAHVMLDSHGDAPIVPSTKPLLMFTATDLDDAMALARSLSDTVTEPEDIGGAVVFYLADPDGHRICIKVDKA